ncbi:MAG: flavodoxin family protein [Acetobacterium sp.]
MKNLVVYYTKSGNTEKLATAIGEELSCTVQTIAEPIANKVDILFLGASVYKFGIDKKVIAYINDLDAQKIGSVVIFATSGKLENVAYSKMAELIAAKGIKVEAENFYCKGKFLSMNKNHPDEEDLKAVRDFAKAMIIK